MGFSWKRGLAAAPILAYLAGAPLARAEALDVAFELGPLDVYGPGDHMLALGAGESVQCSMRMQPHFKPSSSASRQRSRAQRGVMINYFARSV